MICTFRVRYIEGAAQLLEMSICVCWWGLPCNYALGSKPETNPFGDHVLDKLQYGKVGWDGKELRFLRTYGPQNGEAVGCRGLGLGSLARNWGRRV